MLELLVDLDFAPKRLFHLRCLYHTLVEQLDGDFDTAGLMNGKLNGAIAALAQQLILELELL